MRPALRFLIIMVAASSTIAASMLWSAGAQPRPLGEDQARREIDAIYKGDYRTAFRERKPELFLKHIPDDLQIGHG